jgi:hypothetical protein
VAWHHHHGIITEEEKSEREQHNYPSPDKILGMKPFSCIFLFSLLLVLPTVLSVDYQFFMLVLSWPVSYCRPPVVCKSGIPLPPFFTIQGLWPSTKFPPYPEHCIAPDLKEMDVCLSILHNYFIFGLNILWF